MSDSYYMKMALELAKLGDGYTSPNPNVGCVIVKNGKIIGKGYHKNYGDKHAEAVAIDAATESVENATLYCNLEPCCHTIPEKKTPPCTNRIIKEKIARVVVATKDPNPFVNGKGISELRSNGIEVKTGILADDSILLNEKYFKFIQTNAPFVHLKIAQSLDGRIATQSGNSKWITSAKARKIVHEWRAQHDAVLIGVKTALKDNPSLTVRDVKGKNPYRIILDEDLVLPDNLKLISDELQNRTIIFTALEPAHPRVMELMSREIQIISVPKNCNSQLDLNAVLQKLSDLKIASILVEGGGQVFTSFIKNRLFDKISVFLAPIIIGNGIESIGKLGIESIANAMKLENVNINILDNEVLFSGYRNFKSIFNKNEIK